MESDDLNMDINEALEKICVDQKRIQQTFSGNTNLYKRFLLKFTDDPSFNSLMQAFEKNDLHEIEVASHTLKGVAGNLGFEKLFDLSTEILALARGGDAAGIATLMEQAAEEYNRIIPYIREIK